jgi:outer membrane receptor protein involved in Fe transport
LLGGVDLLQCGKTANYAGFFGPRRIDRNCWGLNEEFTLAVATLATAPLGALAQTAGGLEEIVVTAQRREQNLQEVPISVSAFSAQALEKSNVRAATDYLAA